MTQPDGEFEQFAQVIRALTPIAELTANGQDQVLASGAMVRIDPTGTLFREGDTDNYAYWLLEGSLDLQVGDRLLRSMTGGREASLQPLAQLRPRQMTARATTEVFVFPRGPKAN